MGGQCYIVFCTLAAEVIHCITSGGEAVWEDKGSKVAAKQVSRTAGPLTPIQIETPKQTNREVWNTR